MLAGGLFAPAAAHAGALPARTVAISWAHTQRGAPYVWGGAGPYWSGYDCSGLVAAAYARAGKYLPHSTYAMLRSGRLIREPSWAVHAGDLAFFGSGHVELVEFGGWYWTPTFGAQNSGTRVGVHYASVWWHPTSYWRVRLCGFSCCSACLRWSPRGMR